jgi:small conductance mechanosensitive channel
MLIRHPWFPPPIGAVAFALLWVGTATAQQDPSRAVIAAQDSIDRAESLFAEALSLTVGVRELEARGAGLTGEDSVIIVQRRDRRSDDALAVVGAWVDLVEKLDPSNPAIRAQLDSVETLLARAGDRFRLERRETESLISSMRVPRDTLHGLLLLDHERAIARQSAVLNTNALEFSRLGRWYERLGLDSRGLAEEADSIVQARADDLSFRIGIVVDLRRDLRGAIKGAPEAEAQALALDQLALDARLGNNTSSLREMIRLLDGRGQETARYRQLLITATGALTTDILDGRVALGLAAEGLDAIGTWLMTDGVQLLFRLLIFALIILASMFGARVVRGIIRRGFARSGTYSALMRETVLSLTGKAVMVLGLLIGLSQMGVSLGPLLAGLGVAGFIVGFALQDALSNFAAGFMIVVYEPYDVGDLIEVTGARGKVDGMSLVATSIRTLDNQLLIIPNSRIWGDVIRNVTSQRVRRVDLTFGVAYDTDLDEAEGILTELVEQHEMVLSEPPPVIKVHELGDSSVDFIVRPWCRTDDYWDVYWDLTRGVKEAFDAAGIVIPFPQREVHLRTVNETAKNDDEE